MNRRMMFAMTLSVASVFASEAVYAAPVTAVRVPVMAMFGKTKMVKFNLRNDTSAPLKLKAGDNAMTLDVGKSLQVQLPVGTRVVADGDTSTHKSGDVIAEASPELSGVTIGIK